MRELAEGDDNLFKFMGKGRETLGRLLARTIAKGTSINTTTGTERTESVELKTFSGSITLFISNKEDREE